ncbi:flagellar biosynthesis anti-sigma factor FlgM [Candidatus Woesearchaeota archaeon]|jgi:hypothetical protein|nr:flagellar biosynthesis anti-sigma factor FlgM [Candidatus Woesearchaeota archaeon]MBT5397039.1 flagellar biosynthesis anti-sigma factor FlgM [Candidatus Woesearchaeota archaeon]MBT6367415.1 flagellar biosynthesis anti-sigma factor FlgM [Candidatus Woesearchaeota archaeon]MBT7762439.1 flagellar biosynthesis anti-sigma factor FlgM [Candidatus Woesearchaeota archaeon]
MMKKLFLTILVLSLLIVTVSAEEHTTKKDTLFCLPCGDACAPSDFVAVAMCLPPTRDFSCGVENGRCIVVLNGDIDEQNEPISLSEPTKTIVDGGMTPDSALYFLDRLFDTFGNTIEIKEEKVSEIKVMIEEGKIDAAKVALQNYYKQALELEKEVSPDEREDVLLSAAVIKQVMEELEDLIPENDRKEFVDDILNQESSIATAAEIASKINELCRDLSKIDPSQYYEVCNTEEDSPEWQKDLHEDLTGTQIEEAKKFGKIMSQCFESAGRDCQCDQIPFPEFSQACSKAAPLAVACDNGDEAACGKLDDLDMPELPNHLQDVFDDLEGEVEGARFDLHMPPECVEAGATTAKECGNVMTQLHAPEECKEALLAAEPETEREGREICDKIMMELHSPECVTEGITDQDECKDYMFNIDRRPQECADNDIHDLRDCKEFLKNGGGSDFTIDFNCKGIDDPMERLNCFDKASSQASGFTGFDDDNYDGPCMTDSDWNDKKQECRDLYGEHAGDEPVMGDSGRGYECTIDATCIDFGQFKDDDYNMRWEEIQEKQKECASQCASENKPWDFREGVCICKDEEFFPRDGPPQYGDDDWVESECSDGCQQECGDQNTDCVDGNCICLGYGSNGPPSDDSSGGDDEPIVEDPTQGGAIDGPGSGDGGPIEEPVDDTGDDSSSSDGDSTDSGSSDDSSSETDSGSGSSDSGSSDSGSSESGSSDSGSSDSGSSDSGSSDSGSSDSGSSDSGSSESSDSGGDAITGSAVAFWNYFLD